MSSSTEAEPTEIDWDVLVVGRSYAGLSAALSLGRARRSTLVVGSGGPRNETVAHAHGLLTNDHRAPENVIATAERELSRYPTIELVGDRVTALVAIEGGFRASIGPRTTTARTVILATGANDNPPAIPGLAEHWGRGVFTCPYCDGFEHADTHVGVLGAPPFVAHLARILTGWTEHVTVFDKTMFDKTVFDETASDDGLDQTAAADLRAHGVHIERRAIVRLVGDGERVTAVDLDDGTTMPIGALFLAQLPVPNNQLARALGCSVDDNGFVVVDASKRTDVSGVWAIGDLASARASMALAIADGVLAATDCNFALLEREWAAA